MDTENEPPCIGDTEQSAPTARESPPIHKDSSPSAQLGDHI
jgi:hypothetical protein